MDLDIKEEVYKIKVGAEIFKVNFPSWRQAKQIEEERKELGDDNEKAVDFMVNKLKEFGLDDKFFDLPAVKAHHVFQVWRDINSIKK